MMERAKIVAAIVDLGGEDGRAVSLQAIRRTFHYSAHFAFELALVQLRDAGAVELSPCELQWCRLEDLGTLPGIQVEGLRYEFVRLKKKVEPELPARPHNT